MGDGTQNSPTHHLVGGITHITYHPWVIWVIHPGLWVMAPFRPLVKIDEFCNFDEFFKIENSSKIAKKLQRKAIFSPSCEFWARKVVHGEKFITMNKLPWSKFAYLSKTIQYRVKKTKKTVLLRFLVKIFQIFFKNHS